MDNRTVTICGRRKGPWLCLVLLIGLAVVLGENPAHAQQQTKPPATPFVGSQRQERLKERDRYDQQSRQLSADGKLPEAVAVAEKMLAIDRQVYGPEDDHIVDGLDWLAQLHAEENDWAAARKLNEERLALCQKLHGSDNWRVTDARQELALIEQVSAFNPDQRKRVAEAKQLLSKVEVLCGQGKFREALESCRQALATYKELLGEKTRSVDSAIGWLGTVYERLGDYAQAEPALRQAIAIRKQVSGENHPDYSSDVNNLAYFYQLVGKYSQAGPLFQQALAIEQRTRGKHREYAIMLGNVGRLYRQMGAYAKAEPLLQEAVAIDKELLGDKHQDYARALSDLAGLYKDEGLYAKAEPLFRQVLEIEKAALGEQHPTYAYSLNDLAGLYEEQGLYGKAEPLYRQSLEIEKTALGEQHPDYATGLNNLAGLYESMQNFSQAEALYREALNVTRRALGDKNPQYANRLNNLAVLYLNKGDNAKATRIAQQALEVARAVWGEHHPEYATALSNLSEVYYRRKDYPKAEAIKRHALAIDKEALGENHPTYAVYLHDLAWLYSDIKEYAKAAPLFRQAASIRKQVLGKKHPDYRSSLKGLVEALRALADADVERRDFAAARKACEEWRDTQAACFGENSWQVADAHRELADVDRLEKMDANLRGQLAEANQLVKRAEKLQEESRYREAIPLVQQALKIQQTILGEKHWRSASSLFYLGFLYRNVGQLAEAEIADRQALTLQTTVLGDQHPDTVTTMHNLAHVYESLGEFAQAESLYRRSLELRRKVQSRPDDSYANTLNSLAQVALSLGQYARCESTFQEALRIRKEGLGNETPNYADSLLGLAWYYMEVGDYAKAEPLLRQAVAIYKNTCGDQSPYYARSLDYLGSLYMDLRDYAKAEPLYQQAMAIRKQVLGEQNEDYGISLNNLAILYKETGEYSKAEVLCRQVLALDQHQFGQHALGCVLAMSNLAALYDAMGKYAEAEPLLEEAMAIRAQKQGKDHPNYAASLRLLASHYARMKKPEKALPLIQQAIQVLWRHFDRTAAAQSERQQLAFRTSIRNSFQLYLSLTAQLQTPAEEVYSEVLAWKAPVSAMQLSLRRMRHAVAKEGGQSETARLFTELEQTTHTLAARSHAVPDPGAAIPLRDELEELSEKVESLQQKLAAASVDFRKALETQQRTAQDIARALPVDAVLVDYLEYGRFTPAGKPGKELSWPMHLAAFVVRRGQPVRRIELGPIEPISQAVDAWRKDYGLGGTAAADLRRLVWEPLSALVDQAHVVLISPTSALARLPFAALPSKRPGTYLLDEYALALIPVPRLLPELIANVPTASQAPSLLLVGDVNFGADPGQRNQLAAARSAIRRYQTVYWPPLPGTREEVMDIEESFRRRFVNAACTELTQGGATKSAVQREAGKHEYLHFSTHGFFTPPQAPAAAPNQPAGADSGAGKNVTDYQPGLLSGLVFSGANRPAEEGKDDGILTALEVEEMDLSRVQLATLSACETGLGQSAGGEGLLGLQRAFQTAGARTVVVSLWKVPDEETRALMAAFYTNLWQRKLSPLESLRQAQLALLRSYDRQAGRLRAPNFSQAAALPTGGAAQKTDAGQRARLSPLYWAAFVLSGDWR